MRIETRFQVLGGSLVAAAICLFPGRLVLGQQQPAYSADVKVVNVLAGVRNKQGQVVRNLTKDDFVLEEGGRPQKIRYFAQESDLVLTLGLLVDTSMSQRQVLGQERAASYRFFDQVLREDKDLAFVIHFDKEVELLQDLTASRKKLETALGSLETPEQGDWGGGRRGGDSRGQGRRGGGTALYDAVLLASDELMSKPHGRKAVILLSDGVDRGSKVTLEKAIESAQRADTLVYSILFAGQQGFGGFGGRPGMGRYGGRRGRMPETRPDGKKILERVSRETGGGFFEVSKKQPIDQIFAHINEDLRNQYSLGYTSDAANGAGGYRKIRVTTKQKGLLVQARDGYYAAP